MATVGKKIGILVSDAVAESDDNKVGGSELGKAVEDEIGEVLGNKVWSRF